jgi:hypothetical protein
MMNKGEMLMTTLANNQSKWDEIFNSLGDGSNNYTRQLLKHMRMYSITDEQVQTLKTALQAAQNPKDPQLTKILEELGFPIEALVAALDIGIRELKTVEPEVLQEKSNIRDMEILREGLKNKPPKIATSRGEYTPLEFMTSERGSHITSQALFYALRSQQLELTSKHEADWKMLKTKIFSFPHSIFEDDLKRLPEMQKRVNAINSDGQHRYKGS